MPAEKFTGPITPHPRYTAWAPRWKTCEDVISGARAVKDGGEVYLPRLQGDTDADYERYKSRAAWLGASGRTVDALVGAIMRRPMEVTASAIVQTDLETGVTSDGATISQFSSRVLREVLTTGRALVLIDWDEDNKRPVWRLYGSLSIVNWQETRTGIIESLTLLETETVPKVDFEGKEKKWGKEVVLRPKRIFLTPQGTVRVEVWRQMTSEERQSAIYGADDPNEGWTIESSRDWLRFGKPLTSIPVAAVSAEGRGLAPVKLPLEDLCLLNIDHYRVSAMLGQAMFYTASPVYYASGVDKTDDKITIQSRTMLTVGPGMGGEKPTIGILEYNGAGVQPIIDRLEQLERQMATLGARPLTQHSVASTAPEAIRLRASGEQAQLARVVSAVESSITHAVREHASWRGLSDSSAEVEINRDFMPAKMDAAEIKALLDMVLARQLSTEAFLGALVAGEILTKKQAVVPPDAEEGKPPTASDKLEAERLKAEQMAQAAKAGDKEDKTDGSGSDREGARGAAGRSKDGNQAR